MTYVLAHPFRLVGNHLAVVDDGSDAGLAQEIAVLVCTRPGERRLVPDYGITEPVDYGLSLAEINLGLAIYGPDNLVVTDAVTTVVDRSTQATELHFDSTPPPATSAAGSYQ